MYNKLKNNGRVYLNENQKKTSLAMSRETRLGQASHCQLSNIIHEYRTENGLKMDNTYTLQNPRF